MNKRPHSVTAISFVFVAAGVIGLAYHLTEFKAWHPFDYDVLWVCLVRVIAVVCGVCMLRGSNWARWLTVVWIAYHAILSGFHSLDELAVHSVLLIVIAYVLFRPEATKYFRGVRTRTGG
jgi:hypothetical protein